MQNKLGKSEIEKNIGNDFYSEATFIEDNYDFAIIDNSPSRNSLLNMSYIAADFMIIPTECDTGSIDGIDAIYGDLSKYRKINWTNAKVVALILTKYENTAMHTLALEQLDEKANEMEEHPIVMKVRKGIKVSESKLAMQSLQKYDKYSNPAFDYRDIAKALVERLGA